MWTRTAFFTILDSLRNRLFQFDKDSNLLFVFGGTTSQLGCFSEASAVESFDGNVLVLDSRALRLPCSGRPNSAVWSGRAHC